MSLTPIPTFDQLAADPARAASLPLEVVEALLSQCHVIEGALLTRLLAAQARADGQPEASGEGDRLLTIAEVADLLGVPKGYAYELARRGDLPTVRFGKYVRVAISALREWVARHQEKALDKPLYKMYSRTKGRDDWRGTSANSKTAEAHPGGLGRAPGCHADHRGPMGTGRGPHPGGDGPVDPLPGKDRTEKKS